MSQHVIQGGDWSTSLDGGGRDSGKPSEERSHLLHLLDERLRFETLLSRLSATFINLPAEEVDGRVERGLQQIVEFLGVERSSLGQFSEDGSELVVTHSYAAPGLPPFPRVNLAAMWPWYTERMRRGEVLCFSRLPDELPPEAVQEREYCLQSGALSHLAIPFKVGEVVRGGIGFGAFVKQRNWPDDVVLCLRLAGEIFANALARKDAEENKARLHLQLARAARVTLMGELAASIAHEVNQPLCAIVSNAQTVQRLLTGGDFDLVEVREALVDIARDGQRASAVIARVRGFLNKDSAERSPVDVNDLVREVSALMRGEMARRGIAVRLDLAEGLPPTGGDRVQLQQVVLNLMINGADAMEGVARGLRELVIRSAGEGTGAVAVAVKDAGEGLNPADIDRVFDPFYTTKPGGMGMGLAICRSIIEAHGGRIWADPTSGGGTTFQFTLPRLGEGAP